jgi:hypothetical protein
VVMRQHTFIRFECCIVWRGINITGNVIFVVIFKAQVVPIKHVYIQSKVNGLYQQLRS